MSDRATADDEASRNNVAQLPEADDAPDVEAYETEGGVVLYDADNPLAWLKASNAVALVESR
ncbi:DUF7331 family protein [Halocalculus aciditolerans]|uniref:Uncharacterized protein n=1 Tax=Halocalculus aciditolerans TaxID=1383812 RepID=A0A830FJM9_9EURY|nr:hypothetical protein [Halocalculus aciditolerans]GGL61836.1 hypothetical protein GCM10009039_20050 [Halocalculus aciditolerans]